MAFTKVCLVEDIWEGEMEAFQVNGHEVLLVGIDGGDIKAFQGVCPHQDIALIEGKFDGKTIICKAHLWQFDASNGKGINPSNCALAEYPLQIDGNDVLIDTTSIEPLFAQA